MKSRIMYFAPGRAAPGMILAKAVTDRDGKTLLTAETVLDVEMLDRLIRRGVETVSVLVPDTRDDDTIAEELRVAIARVDTIFRSTGSGAREGLHRAVLDYRTESAR